MQHYGPEAFDNATIPALREGYVSVIRHNSDVPGLVQLYSQMSVDAADEQHPAHRFFVERGENLRGVFASVIATRAEAGDITDRIDPETLARILQAVADGLQLQWMLEPDVDMAGIVAQLFDALTQTPIDRNPE
jgi:hypothetical protein